MNPKIRQAMEQIQRVIDDLKSDQVSIDGIRELLRHKSSLVRVNAIEALARQAKHDESLIDDIVQTIENPENSVRLIGARISHVAILNLFKVGTPKAVTAGKRLLETWAEPDCSDLLWFLKSEGLPVDTFVSHHKSTTDVQPMRV